MCLPQVLEEGSLRWLRDVGVEALSGGGEVLLLDLQLGLSSHRSGRALRANYSHHGGLQRFLLRFYELLLGYGATSQDHLHVQVVRQILQTRSANGARLHGNLPRGA